MNFLNVWNLLPFNKRTIANFTLHKHLRVFFKKLDCLLHCHIFHNYARLHFKIWLCSPTRYFEEWLESLLPSRRLKKALLSQHSSFILQPLLIGKDKNSLLLEHLISKFKTLDTFELSVRLFALHWRYVLKNPLKHVLLCKLEPILVRDLASYYTSGCWLHSWHAVYPQKFQNLELLPTKVLLNEKLLFQLSDFKNLLSRIMMFISVTIPLRALCNHWYCHYVIWVFIHAISGFLYLPNYHVHHHRLWRFVWFCFLSV